MTHLSAKLVALILPALWAGRAIAAVAATG
jgi:hypothetical protein